MSRKNKSPTLWIVGAHPLTRNETLTWYDSRVEDNMRRRALVLLLASCFVAPFAFSDFEAGWRAYQQDDYPKALSEWQPLAEKGDAHAQAWLGDMYRLGQGVPKDD